MVQIHNKYTAAVMKSCMKQSYIYNLTKAWPGQIRCSRQYNLSQIKINFWECTILGGGSSFINFGLLIIIISFGNIGMCSMIYLLFYSLDLCDMKAFTVIMISLCITLGNMSPQLRDLRL